MEVAAASIGIAGFAFQVFEGCVQGFAFFNAAQNIGNDGDLFRAGLEMEKYRFLMWAKRAGISQEGIDENTNINWQLATMILEQLRGFLTSAENLRKRYKLDVVEDEVQDSEKVVVAEAPKQGLARLVSRLRPEIYTTTARIIQGNNGPGKRLRWAAVGKDQATRIVAEIAKMNGRLEFLLDSAQRELQAAESARFARSLISWSSTTTEVASIRLLLGDASAPQSDERGAIRAAALVKQIRLCIGSDQRDDEIQPQPKETRGTVPPLKILKRTLRPFAGQALAYRGLEFAVYDKQQVLVQWKVAEDEQWSKHLDQMKSLAVLLSSLSDQSFRCLACLGYLAAESLGRHGLVFTLPAATAGPWRMASLSQLLEQQSQVPLNKRVQISYALAETVLQLHTSGWLHKNLKSSNVIFLGAQDAPLEDMLGSEPFVMGYDFARPDTEAAAMALTELAEVDLVADLYRHPKARGLDRETYQKRFDMYALGSVIVEVMGWESLLSLHEQFTTPDLEDAMTEAVQLNSVIEIPAVWDLLNDDRAVASLRHRVGERMVDIMIRCANMARVEDGQDAGLEVQEGIVEALSRLRLL